MCPNGVVIYSSSMFSLRNSYDWNGNCVFNIHLRYMPFLFTGHTRRPVHTCIEGNDIIKQKHFLHYCAWTNGWANNRDAGVSVISFLQLHLSAIIMWFNIAWCSDIPNSAAVIGGEHKSQIKFTTNTPYLVFTGELWGRLITLTS